MSGYAVFAMLRICLLQSVHVMFAGSADSEPARVLATLGMLEIVSGPYVFWIFVSVWVMQFVLADVLKIESVGQSVAHTVQL